MIEKIFEQVKDKWNQTTEQGIKDFVEIPALSPDFDKKWEENGVLLKAVEFAKNWVEKQSIGISISCAKKLFKEIAECIERGEFTEDY